MDLVPLCALTQAPLSDPVYFADDTEFIYERAALMSRELSATATSSFPQSG